MSQAADTRTMPDPTPPVAARVPVVTALHGDRREDDYAWLRDRNDPKVIGHLEAENAYAEAQTRALEPFRKRLYDEMLARIQQTDLSAPYRKGAYWYYSRTEEGEQYPKYCRRRGSMDGAEEVLLDLNAMAKGHSFMAIGDFEVSPDDQLLAYSTDHTGYRQYALHVKDLRTGADLGDRAERVTSVAWMSDNRTLYYSTEDEVTKRSNLVWTHVLGGRHTQVFEEKDERFDVSVALSRSERVLFLVSSSHTTSEVRLLNADATDGEWKLIAPRRQDIEYYADHHGDELLIRVNDTGRNFRLVTAPLSDPSPGRWVEVVPHRDHVLLTSVACFRNHFVVGERENALPHIAVGSYATHALQRMAFEEAAYAVGPSNNPEYDARTFRYSYQSFVTPQTIFDLDVETFASTLVKRTPVLGDYDPSRYVIERLWATAPDGVKVPISLVRRKDAPRDGSAPCLLYGYGSYGISANVSFSSSRFSLVDRGVTYAVAHIRGGSDLGQQWHDDGRMAKKMNTFTDFIACADTLVSSGLTRRDRLAIQGGSAGGLLMGAVVNLRPDLAKAVVLQVPFVDVINTMLDEHLPLTVGEFEEWGNPKDPKDYANMRAYCPYSNLARHAYPAMLVRTGLNDSQVGFWEPAKYVAKLRTLKTDGNPLLFRIHMGAGHGGASGRYDALKDVAFDYAWILDQLGAGEHAQRP